MGEEGRKDMGEEGWKGASLAVSARFHQNFPHISLIIHVDLVIRTCLSDTVDVSSLPSFSLQEIRSTIGPLVESAGYGNSSL